MSTQAIAGGPEAFPLLPRLAPLFVAMAVGFLTVSMPLPALPLHVSAMGFGTAVAGLLIGVQSLATIVTRPSAGRMVDARGAEATLQRGLALSSGAGRLYLASLAVPQPGPSLLVLLACGLVLGAGESLLITGVLSWAIARAAPAGPWPGTAWRNTAPSPSARVRGSGSTEPSASPRSAPAPRSWVVGPFEIQPG